MNALLIGLPAENINHLIPVFTTGAVLYSQCRLQEHKKWRIQATLSIPQLAELVSL